MIKIRIVFYFLTFIFGVSSCICVKPVEVKSFESVNLIERTNNHVKMQVVLRIDNPNNYKIKLKKYDLEALINNRSMGKLGLRDKVVIPKRCEGSYTFNLDADITPLMAALPMIMLTRSATVALKGTVTAKVFLVRRKINIDVKERVSAKDFNF